MNVTRGTRVATIAVGAALMLAACGDDGGSATSAGGSAATTATAAAASAATTAAKSSGDGYYGSDSGSASTTTAKAAVTTVAASAAASGGTVVMVADVKGVGSVLVDGAGRTLYLFEKDTGTKSACTVDPCKAAWPAFAGSGTASAGTGAQAAKIGAADAQLTGQVTYNGHLLYYFAGDKAPGDANGVGIPGWYLLDANGDKIG